MQNTFILRNTNALVTFVLVTVVAFTLLYVNSAAAHDWWKIFIVSLFAVAGGCYVLSLLRPQAMGLSPPHVMLTLGFGGMLIGLFFDFQRTPVAIIASICATTQNLSFIDSLRLHILLMPYMHVGMLIGGLAAIPSLRLLRPECRKLCSLLTQNILCSVWMLLGMTLGAVFFVQVFQQSSASNLSLGAMLAGMFVGMVWGMVFSVFLYRTYFRWRDQQYG